MREKISLAFFLFKARVLHQDGRISRPFSITVFGKPVTVHIRNNFADPFILHEVFRANEYEADLPEETPPVLFDVGANTGFLAVYLALRYPRARIFCFEPDPDNFRLLLANTEHCANVRCYQVALGREKGTLPFYRDAVFHMRNSLLPIARATEIVVPVETLADAMAEAGVEHIDLLKFDIEGGELGLFSPDAPLDRITAIVGEMHPYRMSAEDYDALMKCLSVRFDISIRTEGKKVFVYGKKK